MDDSKTKSSRRPRRNRRSHSLYSDSDESKSKRKRSSSHHKDQSDVALTKSKLYSNSRSASKSGSRTPVSKSKESSYNNSYRSRSMSHSSDNVSRHYKSSHRCQSRSCSIYSSPSYEEKNKTSQSPQVKDKNKSKDPRDKSKREVWKNKVYIVGEIMKDCVFHFCDTCQMPIFIYRRLIPCKHIFCYACGNKYQDKKCPRCDKKVLQVERCNFGTIFMCYEGGPKHGSHGCRRTYLSQRDLDSHINHRHRKDDNPCTSNILPNKPCSLMSLSCPPPINMLGSTFINSFPGHFQQNQIQSIIHQQQQQQQLPMNQMQSQQLNSLNSSQVNQMIRPLGNILANINSQSRSANQQQINSSQSQMVNASQNFGLQMPSMNMMSMNMNQNALSMLNQTSQHVGLPNVANNSAPQLGPNNVFMHGGAPNNSTNLQMMSGMNAGFGGSGNQPPLMAQITSLIQGMSQPQAGRQFHMPQTMHNQQSGWINQCLHGQINPGSNN